MTIIDTLKQDYDQYLDHCLDVLGRKTDILDIDLHTVKQISRTLFLLKKGSCQSATPSLF